MVGDVKASSALSAVALRDQAESLGAAPMPILTSGMATADCQRGRNGRVVWPATKKTGGTKSTAVGGETAPIGTCNRPGCGLGLPRGPWQRGSQGRGGCLTTPRPPLLKAFGKNEKNESFGTPPPPSYPLDWPPKPTYDLP